MLSLVIIGVYFLVMIAIGVVSRKKTGGIDDFFVAGRRGSTFFVTGSLLATIIGGSATVGMAGLGFQRGLTGAWWLLVGSVGLLVLGIFFARKVREFGLYTLPELVEKQYDGRVALVSSILIVIAWIGVVAGQIVAAGTILGVLWIGSPILWMVIFAVVFIVYTVLGGQYAVIRTDVIQIVIIFVGIFGGLGLLLWHLGGWYGLQVALSPDKFAFPVSSQFDGFNLVTLLLLVGLTYVVGPDMYSRLFCAKEGKSGRASVLWAALLIIPFGFAITLIGMGASALFPNITPEQAFPAVILEVLHPVMGGVVLAALLGAVMSSADTCLLSASTILTVDVVGRFKPSLGQRQVLNLSRWIMVILGLLALLLALRLGRVIEALLFAYTVYTSGVILPVIAGFYKSKLRITPLGALVAVVGGGASALLIKLFNLGTILDIRWLGLVGLLLSGVLLFVVSLVDNKIKSGKDFANRKYSE